MPRVGIGGRAQGSRAFLEAVEAFGEEALSWQLEAAAATDEGEVDPRVAAWDAQVAADQARASEPIRVAFVGRPNVGKSSLLNRLLGEERVIVSEIPGTTRDAIDTAFDWNGAAIRLIDTAGLRRRGKVASGRTRRYSALRSFRAIERADVAVLLIDAADGLTAQDAHVAGSVVDEGRGLVVAVNKWTSWRRPTGPSTSSPPASGHRSCSLTSHQSSPSAP